jgi:hypothetical protein
MVKIQSFQRLLTIAVGTTQTTLGGFLSIMAYLIYATPSFQTLLALTQRELPLYCFVLLFLGIFLVLSGLLLLLKQKPNQEAT